MDRLTALYTQKQLEIYKRCLRGDWFMLINHGAKRSGKTILNNDLFLSEVKKVRERADKLGVAVPQYILSGASLGTINKNILVELYNKYGFIPKFDKFNSFELFGVKVVQTGHSSIGGLASIRGMTAFGAYINEASLANEEVFNEILSRCSGEGARILADTNPDYPGHWLNRDYILPENDRVLKYRFTIFDNTFLGERYIENMLETTPSGMYTERNIYGQWTIGEGAIYSDFDGTKHIVKQAPDNIVHYYAGVDWGYDHYGSIVIIGETAGGTAYIIDGVAKQYEEIDFWVEQARMFKLKYGNIDFYADSARPEHVVRFAREGLKVHNARKEVVAGIEEVAKLFKADQLFYVRDSIPRFEDEIYQYRWKPNSIKDEPQKEYDDVLDAIRYAIYTERNAKIEINLFKGGF